MFCFILFSLPALRWRPLCVSYIVININFLYQSLFFNKVAGLRPATLLKETLAQVFSCEFCKISKKSFSYRTPPVAASGMFKPSPGYTIILWRKSTGKWTFWLSLFKWHILILILSFKRHFSAENKPWN